MAGRRILLADPHPADRKPFPFKSENLASLRLLNHHLTVTINAMTTIVLTKFAPTALAATAIGLGALMTVGAPSAHASAKSDCESSGGTFSETTIVDNKTGKIGTVHRCCVKDATTNTTSCTSTTVTNNSRIPVNVAPGVIDTAETIEPTRPIQRVPLDVLSTDAQIQPAS